MPRWRVRRCAGQPARDLHEDDDRDADKEDEDELNTDGVVRPEQGGLRQHRLNQLGVHLDPGHRPAVQQDANLERLTAELVEADPHAPGLDSFDADRIDSPLQRAVAVAEHNSPLHLSARSVLR